GSELTHQCKRKPETFRDYTPSSFWHFRFGRQNFDDFARRLTRINRFTTVFLRCFFELHVAKELRMRFVCESCFSTRILATRTMPKGSYPIHHRSCSRAITQSRS